MMSLFKSICKVILICVLVLLPTHQSIADERPVVKVGFAHFPPWISDNGGQVTGYDHDLLTAILGQLGYRPEFVPMKFADLLESLKSGEVDVSASLLFREERNEYIRYVSPAYRTKSTVRFYARKGTNLSIEKYIDIAGLRIGMSRSVRYFPAFDLDDRVVKVLYSSQKEAFKALAAGEVDLTICSGSAGGYYLNELSLGGLLRACKFIYTPKLMPTYVGVSRKSAFVSRADEISEIMLSLQKAGVLDEIAAKYSVQVH